MYARTYLSLNTTHICVIHLCVCVQMLINSKQRAYIETCNKLAKKYNKLVPLQCQPPPPPPHTHAHTCVFVFTECSNIC